MNELEKDFIRDSIAAFEALKRKARAKHFSENFLRENLRVLHTFKGTAQTFDFNIQANLAHEIENLIEAAREKKISLNEEFENLFEESFRHLIELCSQRLAERKTVFPQEFIHKLKRAAKIDAKGESGISLDLPDEFLTKFSKEEKYRLAAALENRENLFVIETAFEFKDFETEFRKYRNAMEKIGEVEATFPSNKFSGKLGFQFFLTTEKPLAEILKQIKSFGGEINFKIENEKRFFPEKPDDFFEQAIKSAKNLAAQTGKEIEFSLSLSEKKVPEKQAKIFFEAILHLTRNAVDHGIEKSGKIFVSLASKKDSNCLTVADDGRGIDADKIRLKAIEKNLLPETSFLSEQEIFDLIFAHGISTEENLSSVSGRGVGLDSVKSSVEKAGGKINVSSRKGKGTTFEIFLPKN